MVESWHDRNIDGGEEWRRNRSENLQRADIILLLISADFIASDYCYEIEMQEAIQRHERGEVCVIPVVLREVNWKSAPFSKLQALPKDAKAVTAWRSRDSAWRNVSEGIEKIVKRLKKSTQGTK